jgi:hypothetical protein
MPASSRRTHPSRPADKLPRTPLWDRPRAPGRVTTHTNRDIASRWSVGFVTNDIGELGYQTCRRRRSRRIAQRERSTSPSARRTESNSIWAPEPGCLGGGLTAAGMVNYPTEWWHWSYGDRYWGTRESTWQEHIGGPAGQSRPGQQRELLPTCPADPGSPRRGSPECCARSRSRPTDLAGWP